VAALDPRPGEAILDVGCGTGLSFGLLEDGIGPEGRLIGVELSGEMLAKARERVAQQGWRNVTLIEAAAREAEIPSDLDGALFVLTHDIVRSPEALTNVLDALRPGGRMVATGSKWAPRWLVPVNAYLWLKARRYVTTFEGFDRPWSRLAELVPGLQVDSILAGAAYVASGTYFGNPAAVRASPRS
jgi:ubiquinone/menaquinone biosynthesis C-methylase UbiE